MRARSWLLLLFTACAPVDLERGGPFLCRFDGGAGQCPGDWHCGLEGRCLRNEPGPWRCLSEAECFGWHCGIEGRCHEPDAGAWACLSNDDCFGWHCGPEGRCYDRSTALGVTCRDDEDCAVSGWRCGPDKTCLETTTEALREAQLGNSVMVVNRSQPLWRGTPHLVDTSRAPEPPFVGGCQRKTVDIATDAGVWRVRLPVYEGVPCTRGATSESTPIADAIDLARLNNLALVLRSDGGWTSIGLEGVRRDGVFPVPVTALRSGFGGVYAFGGRSVVHWAEDVVETVALDGTIVDLVEERSFPPELVALTDRGFHHGRLDAGVPLVGPGCTSWTKLSAQPSSVDVYEPTAFLVRRLVRSTPGSTAPACMATLTAPPWSVSQSWPSLCSPLSWRLTSELGGSDFLNIWCQSTQGPFSQQRDGGVERLPPSVTTNSGSRELLFAGRWPFLYEQRPEQLLPRVPDRAPTSATTIGSMVHAFVPDAVVGTATRPAFTSYLALQDNPWAQSVSRSSRTIAVSGRPGTVLIERAGEFVFHDLGGFITNKGPTIDGTPTAAVGFDRPDAGSFSLVATGEAVHFFDGARTGVAFVASPRATITSIALAPDALGARYAGGYVVASGRIFRFRADNPILWRTDELIVGDEEAVEVFFDGSRARVGMRDGSIFSLPTRTRVAPPTASSVIDFEQVCQHTFALTATNLEHLSVTSSPIGQWGPLAPHPSSSMPVSSGMLYRGPGGLLVFWSDGAVFEVKDLPCAP